MINLLPKDGKKQLRAARNNAVLRRYYMLVLLAAALLGAVFAVGFKVTLDQEASYRTIQAQNEADAARYANVRQAAQDFIKNLQIDKTILASDIRFSDLITEIAGVIPSGVILSNLSLNNQDSKTPLTINARAKSYDAAIALKNSLEASKIFQNVSLLNAGVGTSAQTEGPAAAYPVGVSINAKFVGKASK